MANVAKLQHGMADGGLRDGRGEEARHSNDRGPSARAHMSLEHSS
jgi:hypothetical protein